MAAEFSPAGRRPSELLVVCLGEEAVERIGEPSAPGGVEPNRHNQAKGHLGSLFSNLAREDCGECSRAVGSEVVDVL